MSMSTFASTTKPPNPPLHIPISILLPLFPSFNTLDVNGPVEVLSQANRNYNTFPPPFHITIASSTPLTKSIENVSIARDISLSTALSRINEFDMLLVPGGTEVAILAMIAKWKARSEDEARGDGDNDENEFMRLLDTWMGDGNAMVGKLTLTVCTGSLFFGALGKLGGRKVTTHWRSLRTLEKLCEESTDGGPKAQIVRARWVGSGSPSPSSSSSDASKSWLITAGGVSCGLDATFYLVERMVGPEVAQTVADVLDYARRGREELGEVVGG